MKIPIETLGVSFGIMLLTAFRASAYPTLRSVRGAATVGLTTLAVFGMTVSLLAWSPPASAYGSFQSCSSCHSLFSGGPSNPNHNTHAENAGANFSTFTGCDTCHGSSINNNPSTSNCTQCHGRAEDVGPLLRQLGSAGLRQHHFNSEVTVCTLCHEDANPANYTPVGEDVPPAGYPGVLATGPCNDNEDFLTPNGSTDGSGSRTFGLDNDGDGLTNAADPDCAVATPIRNDVVLNLPSSGVSILLNDNTSSIALSPDTAKAIAVADVDNNGVDDVIVSFPAGTGPTSSGGTWISKNQGALTLLSTHTAEIITAGNFGGPAGDDLFLDFGGPGLWFSVNGGAPFSVVGASPVAMASGDVDNNGQDDLIVSFNGVGTWVFKNLSALVPLDASAAQTLATGDVDGNGAADVIAAFGSGEGPTNSGGTWISRNQGALALLSIHKAEPAIAGDFDGNGQDDLFLDFDSDGLWVSLNDGAPFMVVGVSPVAMASGDVDKNGQDDLILSLNGAGTWVFKNLSALEPLDGAVALDLATGNVDGN